MAMDLPAVALLKYFHGKESRMEKKKLLILRATYFASETPGNVRIRNFAKYLAEAGYDVTVAMLAKGVKDEKAPARQDGYSLSLAYIPIWFNLFARFFDYGVWRFLGYPHNWCLKSRILLRHVAKNFKRGDADLVIVSVPQPGSLPVARVIAKRLGVPWVVDFRDIPDELDVGHKKAITRREFSYTVEQCRDAAFAVTVSKPLKTALLERYGLKDVELVYNGYEGTYRGGSDGILRTKNFDILYTGVFVGGRDPELLLCALDLLQEQGFDLNGVRFIFVGISPETAQRFESHKCYALVLALGKRSRAECLRLQREAGLLVSLASPGCAGILTSKVFDYANASRPVISVPCDHDALDEFIKNAGIGASFDDAKEVAEYLKEQILAWRNGMPAVGYTPNCRYLESFSRKNQTARFAEMISQRFFKN